MRRDGPGQSHVPGPAYGAEMSGERHIEVPVETE